MARTKTDANKVEQLTVRFPKDILEALRESAQANDRSLNAEIVNAARHRVQSYHAKKGDSDYECVGSRDH